MPVTHITCSFDRLKYNVHPLRTSQLIAQQPASQSAGQHAVPDEWLLDKGWAMGKNQHYQQKNVKKMKSCLSRYLICTSTQQHSWNLNELSERERGWEMKSWVFRKLHSIKKKEKMEIKWRRRTSTSKW